MSESPTHTPSSVRASSSPHERSPIVTGVSALSSPTTNNTADVAATPRTDSPPEQDRPALPQRQQQQQHPQRPVVETLSDSDEENSRARARRVHGVVAQAPQLTAADASAVAAPVHITAADYADRRRLLNHITYLSTQLQRAQLQVEDLTRTVCILRGFGNGEEGEAEATVRAAVVDGATSAAVLAARDEAEVHAALQAALAVFDPVIAQTQIYRLDDALAQMGLLREAELAQLQSATAALEEHRTLVARLSAEAAQLRSRTAALEQQKTHAETELTATTLEVQRLRHEEARLNQRLAGLQELAQDSTWLTNVRVVGAAPPGPSTTRTAAHLAAQLARSIEEEERMARQALLLDVFWDPMLIAFDAGLTWLSDSAALHSNERAAATTATVATAAPSEAGVEDRLALVRAGVAVDAAPPPTDADLLLLRRQQEEVTELRARVQLLHDRNRVVELEKERLQFLYENEMRRSERMAQDHVAQLQQAYDEVVKDRQCIMSRLKGEVEEQLRLAFEDGRAYEKHRGGARSRSRPSKKAPRPSSAVT